jgi:hypothetical protein
METKMRASVLLAGIAAFAIAGGTAAWAADSDVHQMTIQLPGGGVEHIMYTGDVKPVVRVVPMSAMPQVAFMPMAFGFPDMARIQAAMNAQMAQMNAMIQHANAMAAQSLANMPNTPIAISNGGSSAYFCERSVQITTDAHGKQNVVEHSAGNCGNGRASTAAAHAPAPKGNPI